ncbi:MAG: RHS repeat-associated core domain-containing protein [Planctomycetota bacterium]
MNRDGDVDSTDENLVYTVEQQGTNEPLADVMMNGSVDNTDTAQVHNNIGNTTTELTYSRLHNSYFFTGRITDTLHASDDEVGNDPDFHRLQDNRNRSYDPKHGRWLQRDPLGVRLDAPKATIDPRKQYTDGMNLYVYARSSPISYYDPYGFTWLVDGYACMGLSANPNTMAMDVGEAISDTFFPPIENPLTGIIALYSHLRSHASGCFSGYVLWQRNTDYDIDCFIWCWLDPGESEWIPLYIGPRDLPDGSFWTLEQCMDVARSLANGTYQWH